MTFKEYVETVKRGIKDYLPEEYKNEKGTWGQFLLPPIYRYLVLAML